MRVVVDTGAVWGLVNRLDQWHRPATLIRSWLDRMGARLLLPRLVVVEVIGHATRLKTQGQSAFEMSRLGTSTLDAVLAFRWPIEEHAPEDFVNAEQWWRDGAQVPLDFPDLVIAATAQRLKAERVWMFDTRLADFVKQKLRGIDVLDQPAPH